jgi:hypothetical protein
VMDSFLLACCSWRFACERNVAIEKRDIVDILLCFCQINRCLVVYMSSFSPALASGS